jgi:formylglycine-generating enzyme required for sulfatase activity
LTNATGFQYRLPSEAEWEFAARAGTQSPYFLGDEITPSAAHSSDNRPADAPLSRSERRINSNPFRLYHMSGNVREWTQDAWYPDYDNAPADGSARLLDSEDQRTVRGGSYADPGTKLQSAAREPLERAHRDAMTGIRIVREIRQQAPDN